MVKRRAKRIDYESILGGKSLKDYAGEKADEGTKARDIINDVTRKAMDDPAIMKQYHYHLGKLVHTIKVSVHTAIDQYKNGNKYYKPKKAKAEESEPSHAPIRAKLCNIQAQIDRLEAQLLDMGAMLEEIYKKVVTDSEKKEEESEVPKIGVVSVREVVPGESEG